MKPFTLKTLWLFFSIATITAIAFSCKKVSPTACTLNCKYGGACLHDSCICPLGYRGKLCEEPTETSVTYVNGSAADVWLILNGKKDTVNAGDSVVVKGLYGSVLSSSAFSYGLSANGQRIGLEVWLDGLSAIFPSSGSVIKEIQIPSRFFFLKVKVTNPSFSVSSVTVNVGTPQESSYPVSIPNDGKEYPVGYFSVVQPCTIYLYSTPAGQRWVMRPTISGSYNLSTTLIAK